METSKTTIRKGYKFILKPELEYDQAFAQFAGACRFVWNKTLGINASRYEFARFARHTPRIPYNDVTGLLKLWKPSEEYGEGLRLVADVDIPAHPAYATVLGNRS